jgi:hypothetical protein
MLCCNPHFRSSTFNLQTTQYCMWRSVSALVCRNWNSTSDFWRSTSSWTNHQMPCGTFLQNLNNFVQIWPPRRVVAVWKLLYSSTTHSYCCFLFGSNRHQPPCNIYHGSSSRPDSRVAKQSTLTFFFSSSKRNEFSFQCTAIHRVLNVFWTNTVLIGQDRQKIILKLNVEILGTYFFSKKN